MTSPGFNSPELLITDYYDALINRVDIIIEEQLMQFEKKSDDSSAISHVENNENSAKLIRNFLNDSRELAIEAIKQSQSINLEYYRENKHLFTFDRSQLDEETIEALRAAIFAKHYCFLVGEKCSFAGHKLTKPRLYEVDFYFDPKNIVLI